MCVYWFRNLSYISEISQLPINTHNLTFTKKKKHRSKKYKRHYLCNKNSILFQCLLLSTENREFNLLHKN